MTGRAIALDVYSWLKAQIDKQAGQRLALTIRRRSVLEGCGATPRAPSKNLMLH